jgi:hypothetical protein
MRQRNNRHHRKPRSLGGTNDSANISLVNERKHEYYHGLFTKQDNTCMTPQEIAEVLTRVWIDPEFALICVPKRNQEEVTKYSHIIQRRK